MNTEITEGNPTKSAGTVFYDGACAFCLVWLRRMERPLGRRGFRFATLQSRWSRRYPTAPPKDVGQNPTEMILELPDGRELGGADAAVEMARRIWWLWPVWALSRIPGMISVFRAGYHWIAQHRHALGGSCKINVPPPHPHRHAAFFEMP